MSHFLNCCRNDSTPWFFSILKERQKWSMQNISFVIGFIILCNIVYHFFTLIVINLLLLFSLYIYHMFWPIIKFTPFSRDSLLFILNNILWAVNLDTCKCNKTTSVYTNTKSKPYYVILSFTWHVLRKNRYNESL